MYQTCTACKSTFGYVSIDRSIAIAAGTRHLFPCIWDLCRSTDALDSMLVFVLLSFYVTGGLKRCGSGSFPSCVSVDQHSL
jgi:hypothetical protein